jgi:DNA repair exonuclease SbcCD ATPase subunit
MEGALEMLKGQFLKDELKKENSELVALRADVEKLKKQKEALEANMTTMKMVFEEQAKLTKQQRDQLEASGMADVDDRVAAAVVVRQSVQARSVGGSVVAADGDGELRSAQLQQLVEKEKAATERISKLTTTLNDTKREVAHQQGRLQKLKAEADGQAVRTQTLI